MYKENFLKIISCVCYWGFKGQTYFKSLYIEISILCILRYGPEVLDVILDFAIKFIKTIKGTLSPSFSEGDFGANSGLFGHLWPSNFMMSELAHFFSSWIICQSLNEESKIKEWSKKREKSETIYTNAQTIALDDVNHWFIRYRRIIYVLQTNGLYQTNQWFVAYKWMVCKTQMTLPLYLSNQTSNYAKDILYFSQRYYIFSEKI